MITQLLTKHIGMCGIYISYYTSSGLVGSHHMLHHYALLLVRPDR